MKILLTSQSGDMFAAANQFFRFPPGTTLYHTSAHRALKEVLEWICPGRFDWREVSLDHFDWVEHETAAGRINVVPRYKGGLDPDLVVLDTSGPSLPVYPTACRAFSEALPCTGPLLVFPTTSAEHKDIPAEILAELRWPEDVLLCLPRDRDFPDVGLPVARRELGTYAAMAPRGVLGASSFPVIYLSWIGFRCLQAHQHPTSYDRARLPWPQCSDVSLQQEGARTLIQDWIDALTVHDA